jgi:hypothetical protein
MQRTVGKSLFDVVCLQSAPTRLQLCKKQLRHHTNTALNASFPRRMHNSTTSKINIGTINKGGIVCSEH